MHPQTRKGRGGGRAAGEFGRGRYGQGPQRTSAAIPGERAELVGLDVGAGLRRSSACPLGKQVLDVQRRLPATRVANKFCI